MALTNGFRLGPYEIMAPIGAGGMGEVYRARDTRLERTVAIKIPCLGSPRRMSFAQWSADGRSVLVYRRAEIPCRLERVDLATGHRTLFKEFAPADRTGLLSMREMFVTDDLRSYAYTAYYQVSSLFVSEGRQ